MTSPDPFLQKPSQSNPAQPVDPYAHGPAQPGPYPAAGPNPADPYAVGANPADGGYGQPGYPPQPGYPQPQPGYPYAQPMYDQWGNPLSDKSKMVAGLLQILLGGFAVGRFYMGYPGIAIAQIAVTWLTCGLGGIWPLIDGIMILMGKVPDAQGRTLRE